MSEQITLGSWEFQGYDETDEYELLMHDRYQQSESEDFGADHGVLVFVATSDDDHGVRGAAQSARLRELLRLVAPDGVIPPMSQVLAEIVTGVNFLFSESPVEQ